jgi:hypothetical protein
VLTDCYLLVMVSTQLGVLELDKLFNAENGKLVFFVVYTQHGLTILSILSDA